MYSKVLKRDTSKIVKEIVDAYTKSTGVFSRKVNAEDLVPKTNKTNQIQFLFWIIQMDYATKSSNLYKNANNLWKENPNWIKTNFIISISEKDLLRMIKNKLKPRYANEIAKRFKENAFKLEEQYNGLAINIINQTDSAKDLLREIRQFRGFGPKLGNFLARTFIDLLELKYKDLNDILQPVDIHDIRLTYEWGLINNKKMTNSNINKVKRIWNKACKEASVSWISFDKALWLIGSEGRRSKNPLNDYITNLGKNL